MRNDKVPIGYVYIQLPNKNSPDQIWPDYNWKDVSEEYAGLFFRANGGDSAKFGQLQDDNSPRIIGISSKTGQAEHIVTDRNHMVLEKGGFSEYFYTGDAVYCDCRHDQQLLKFRVSGGEVRPKNMAIKLWQRIE